VEAQPTVDIAKELASNDVILLIVGENYNQTIIGIIQDIVKKRTNCCYVSLNKPYAQLIKDFNKTGVSHESTIFVDAISGTVGHSSKANNCINVSSPNALTELNITITGVCSHTPQLLIFDSLSALLVYEKGANATKFIHSIINTLRIHKVKGLFLVLESDANTDFIKSVEMFADKTIQI
jgi:hypothetical protein